MKMSATEFAYLIWLGDPLRPHRRWYPQTEKACLLAGWSCIDVATKRRLLTPSGLFHLAREKERRGHA